jgi:hypothetical protein
MRGLETTTFAPESANCSAIAFPIPLVEPVTTATFPVKSNMKILHLGNHKVKQQKAR